MSTEVIMPTLGLTMETGTIVEWLKREGDIVAKDEPLFVVETDKAAMEVPSPTSGVLEQIIAPVGVAIPVRQAIAVIGEGAGTGSRESGVGRQGKAVGAPGTLVSATSGPAETGATPRGTAPAGRQPAAEGPRLRISPAARRVARELGVDVAGLRGSGPEGRIIQRDVLAASASRPTDGPAASRVVASPLARKLAAEHGLELVTLRGSGPGGRIVEKDVRDAVSARLRRAAPPAPAAVPGPPAADTVPLGRLRRITAERMAASARAVARVTLFMRVDMSEAVRFRTQLAPEFEQRYGARLGYDAMFVRCAAMALRDHPTLNAQWAEGAIRMSSEINVGIAIALDEGLLVGVIRGADSKPLHKVQSELSALVDKARSGRLGPDDVSGSTFTITNLGGYQVEAFTPIVNLPEAAILGIGRIAREPAVVDDQLAIRDQTTLSLAFDHRVTDGAPAARFLQRVKEILEAPYILLT